MKVVATNGDNMYRVRLVHWWPLRPGLTWSILERDGYRFGGLPMIPDDLKYKAQKEGSRYMTYTSVKLPNRELSAWARCCPNDQPRRDVGRFIALLRLARTLRPLGYRLEKVT